ncbi:MAG: hypothetical protein AAGC65_12350 [Mucilaginibacter sp.]
MAEQAITGWKSGHRALVSNVCFLPDFSETFLQAALNALNL